MVARIFIIVGLMAFITTAPGCDSAKEFAESAQKKINELSTEAPKAEPITETVPATNPANPPTSTTAEPAPVIAPKPVPVPMVDHAERIKGFLAIRPQDRKDAEFTALADVPAEFLAAIEELKIASPAVTADGLALLRKCSQLKGLALNSMPVSAEMVKIIAEIDTLEALSLEESQISDAAFKELTPLANLRILNLRKTPLTDQGIVVIPGQANLEELNMSETAITGAGLLGKPKLSKLRLLDVSNTKFAPGLLAVKGIVTLEVLLAHYTDVNDKALTQSGGWPNLQTVNLYGCTEVSDIGTLAAFKGSKSLTIANFGRTRISNQTLGMLRFCKDLKEVRAEGTLVNPTGGNALKKLLPDAAILW